MKATAVVRKVMAVKGERVSALADKMRVKSNVLSERLSQENISIGKLDEMLRLMDYKIIVVPRETTEKEGWFRAE